MEAMIVACLGIIGVIGAICYYVLQNRPWMKGIKELLLRVLLAAVILAMVYEYGKRAGMLALLGLAAVPLWVWPILLLFFMFWIFAVRNRQRQEAILSLLNEIKAKLD